MSQIDASWALVGFLRTFKPHESWQDWFAATYVQALKSPTEAQRLKGWLTAAMILGDMHACVLCLFVCLYGRTIGFGGVEGWSAHIDLCLLDMGLARHARTGSVPLVDLGLPETLHRDDDVFSAWMEEQLRLFGGDLRKAAEFSMRITAIRLGLLSGPSDPSLDEVTEENLWMPVGALARELLLPRSAPRLTPAVPERKWWQLWR